jgi:hypothetical protein
MYHNVLSIHCRTMYHNVSQCITMYHNVSQCVTMYHNVSQCITMYHNVSQCTFYSLQDDAESPIGNLTESPSGRDSPSANPLAAQFARVKS